MKKCPYCCQDIVEEAVKCCHCGEWVNTPVPEAVTCSDARRIQIQTPTRTTVVIYKEETLLFPLITLVCYLLFYPLGLLCNIVGLISGERRGCFWVLFLVFFGLPLGLLLLVLGGGVFAAIFASIAGVFGA